MQMGAGSYGLLLTLRKSANSRRVPSAENVAVDDGDEEEEDEEERASLPEIFLSNSVPFFVDEDAEAAANAEVAVEHEDDDDGGDEASDEVGPSFALEAAEDDAGALRAHPFITPSWPAPALASAGPRHPAPLGTGSMAEAQGVREGERR